MRLLVLSLAAAVLSGCAADSGATGPDPADGSPPVAGMCAAGEPDCDDTPTRPPSDPAAGACLEGATECDDVPGSAPPPGDAPDPTRVEPREGLVEVAPTPWEDVQPNPDQTVLTVTWWGGNETCFGLDHVEVDETDEVVTITVHTGRVEGVDACTMEALRKAVEVPLDAPLGPRSIVDGAA